MEIELNKGNNMCLTDSRFPGDDKKKKERVLKGPTDYRPASNSYPMKTLQRD